MADLVNISSLIRMKFVFLLFLGAFIVGPVLTYDPKGFDDSILFSINWPGGDNEIAQDENIAEEMVVTTHNKEKYRCTIPALAEKTPEENFKLYKGQNPAELIAPLFSLTTCSFRMESYWTYEICHGRHIKQYHEERDGKTVKLQEYILGRWNKSATEALLERYVDLEPERLQYKKIEGMRLPYVEVEMRDGTMCDLTETPRVTKVLYVCYKHGKNEVYSIKETSSCNYEVVVLAPDLCRHPLFKVEEKAENPINCFPLENAGKKPRSLLAQEVESLKWRYQKIADFQKPSMKDQKAYAVLKVDPKDGTLRMELIPADLADDPLLVDATDFSEILGLDSSAERPESPPSPPSPTPPSLAADRRPVEEFLAGKNCLTGGTGWWKYEFCYGKHVRQYHVNAISGKADSLLLGKFDREAHLEWLQENPKKRPMPRGTRKSISHFYTDGSLCDKTGRPRQTEVKLQCLENSASLSSVSLYLLEPKICQYVLGVESPLICDILDQADDNGLVPEDGEV